MLIMIREMTTDVKHFAIFIILSTFAFFLVVWFLSHSVEATGDGGHLSEMSNLGEVFVVIWALWWYVNT